MNNAHQSVPNRVQCARSARRPLKRAVELSRFAATFLVISMRVWHQALMSLLLGARYGALREEQDDDAVTSRDDRVHAPAWVLGAHTAKLHVLGCGTGAVPRLFTGASRVLDSAAVTILDAVIDAVARSSRARERGREGVPGELR